MSSKQSTDNVPKKPKGPPPGQPKDTRERQEKTRNGHGGRGSLLTPRFIKRTEQLAAQGLTQKQIATILNVNATTISIWKSRDGKLEEKFRKAIEKGEATGIARRMARIEKAGKKGSWQADAWALERRNPEQFARRDSVRVSDANGNPVAGTTVIAPTVVFIQPKKEDLTETVIDVEATYKHLPNGLPSGNGKEGH